MQLAHFCARDSISAKTCISGPFMLFHVGSLCKNCARTKTTHISVHFSPKHTTNGPFNGLYFVLVCCGSSWVSTTMSARLGQFHQPGLGHGNAGHVTRHSCFGWKLCSLRKSHLDPVGSRYTFIAGHIITGRKPTCRQSPCIWWSGRMLHTTIHCSLNPGTTGSLSKYLHADSLSD